MSRSRDGSQPTKNKIKPWIDGIPAETLKAMREIGIDVIRDICNMIWITGERPDYWCE